MAAEGKDLGGGKIFGGVGDKKIWGYACKKFGQVTGQNILKGGMAKYFQSGVTK